MGPDVPALFRSPAIVPIVHLWLKDTATISLSVDLIVAPTIGQYLPVSRSSATNTVLSVSAG